MKPINVVCYSDGRPGHAKQSLAVLTALQELTPLTTTRLELAHTNGPRRVLQALQALFVCRKEDPEPSVDLILGTGSGTHLPMVGHKMRTGAKLVTCMSPDAWLLPWFDLCFVPRHDRPRRRKKIFPTFGPPCLVLNRERHDLSKGLILAGGVDTKSHHWDTAMLISQIDKLVAKTPGTVWTISSSPRTPADTLEQLRALANANSRIDFFSAEQTPRGWIEQAYEKHAQVWVTADSVSMIYEALTTGCRVGVLPVVWRNSKNKFQRGIDDLMAQGMILDFGRWENGEELPHPSRPLNEADRCAKEILTRWWPDRLP